MKYKKARIYKGCAVVLISVFLVGCSQGRCVDDDLSNLIANNFELCPALTF